MAKFALVLLQLAATGAALNATLNATAEPCSTWRTLRSTAGSYCDRKDSGTAYARDLDKLLGPECTREAAGNQCCWAPLGYDGGADYGTPCATVCSKVVGFQPRLGADDAYCSKSDGSSYGNCFCGPTVAVENRPLEKSTRSFLKKWADHRTGGYHDVTFWRTNPPNTADYRSVILGDRVNIGYSLPTSPIDTMQVPSISTSACGASDVLKEPVALQVTHACNLPYISTPSVPSISHAFPRLSCRCSSSGRITARAAPRTAPSGGWCRP